MVGAKGLGDEARQAKRAPKGQSRRCAQARGHCASHVDRRNRVQLVEEGGCRVTSKRERRVPAERREKTSLPGRWRWWDRPIFCELSIRETALATLIHQRRLTPSCGGQAPTAERTVGPARMIAESLTPKPGIREQYRHKADKSRQLAHVLPFEGRSGRVDSINSMMMMLPLAPHRRVGRRDMELEETRAGCSISNTQSVLVVNAEIY